MMPISAAPSRVPPEVKPARKRGLGDAPTKVIRMEPADLKLIERAARSLNMRSSSYFIVQAAVKEARRILPS